ncbi:MAG: hypothetical protein AB9846_17925 [Tenuifilaceae bacterium]
MKVVFKLVLLSLVFVSCSISKDIINCTFKYKSKKRTLQLVFVNDTVCRLENIFHCNDINSDIKEITAICAYRRNGDTIILKNINCESSDCNYGLFREIPPQESKECDFLNSEKRGKRVTVGPNYLTDYQKYGLVPSIDIDTLYVIKNKIFFNKQNKEMSVSFIFK